MTHDQNKKTLRHFQCRDYLWEIFEQMSAELECSTDYLINEAMRQYARSRNYGARTPAGATGQTGARPMPTGAATIPPLGGSGGTSPRAPIPSAPPAPPKGPPPAPGAGYAGGGGLPSGTFPHPRAQLGGAFAPPAPPKGPPQPPSSYPPPPLPNRPPTLTGTSPPPLPGGRGNSVAPGSMPTLYVIFNGQKIPIKKEEFVIGRGSKTADLAIKDGNISRRHAAVVLQSGNFFIKDLGSTNGIEFGGQRVDSKHIEEGDVFHLCDYELRFTYR